MQTLKILLLEDVEEDAGLVIRELEKEFKSLKTLRVDTKEEFLDALEFFNPDVVLSDHSLPQFNSLEALKISRTQKPDTAFILVTGTVSEEFAVRSLKEGADDYLIKDNLTRLTSAIKNALEKKTSEKERKTAEESLLKRNDELVKINQELDRFVYSASHDLRAPLKSVLGLINLVKEESTGTNNCKKSLEKIFSYSGLMEKSVIRLDNTIKDIIDYSRNSRKDLVSEEVDLYNLINEVKESLQYMEGFSEMNFNIFINPSLRVFSDKNRLKM
ncbi:MAG: response regulator [Cytophagaceae bacterium]